MVNTRHRAETDTDPTCGPQAGGGAERGRPSLKLAKGDEATISSQSDRAYGRRGDAYNIFKEKVVDSRLRPRVGPSRTYNYIDVDSSDEELIRRRHSHFHAQGYSPDRRRGSMYGSREMKQELLEGPSRPRRCRSSPQDDTEDQSSEDDDEEVNRSGRTMRQHTLVRNKGSEANERSRSSVSRRLHLSLEDHEKNNRNIKTRRRSSEDDEKRRSSKQHSLADDDEQFIRRSSRTRRQVYDTLNQSYLVSIPGQPRSQLRDNQDQSDAKDMDTDDNQEFSDMYSRVKRKRVRIKRNMYGVPISDDSDSEPDANESSRNNENEDDEEEDDDDVSEEGERLKDSGSQGKVTRKAKTGPEQKKPPEVVKSYSLREHKPRTDLYKAPVEEPRIKRGHPSLFSSAQNKKVRNQAYQSPAQKRKVRKRSAFHSSSSSTSSSSESSDEKSFNKRKAKSMDKARSRMMPLNYSSASSVPSTCLDRVRSGASLADIEPMSIDKNVTFDSIGGLGKHIRSLKEMIVFPLLYDQVFQHFKVDPPRGVLFYGPPGTGKTLVARALANECSHGNKKVAFFMRKGADCLSKWVGESERQLRLLFDQAYRYRPSIIFFDEIDGLAPVRSSRQDQIHSSIVSTLLALMDGLDSRGEIVVIGATNRIDSIDPALRRPGRFDREFFFGLPTAEARKQILKIHTAGWPPRLSDSFLAELAEKCVGYSGADCKSLCTEATMSALRRRYPQIYISNEALQLDVASIQVSAKDFFDAMNSIVPTAQRAASTPARALPARVSPLLEGVLDQVLGRLADIFPPSLAQSSSLEAAVTSSQAEALAKSGNLLDGFASDEDENAPSIFVPTTPVKVKASKSSKQSLGDRLGSTTPTIPFLNFASYATHRPSTYRPRLLLVGLEGQGQTTYLAPAVLHKMEYFPVQVVDLPALYSVTASSPEESCAAIFREARRKCPSIIYLPYINKWWDVMSETVRACLLTLVQNLDPSLPLLLLATSEQSYHELDPGLQSLFSHTSGQVVKMTNPTAAERKTFFQDLILTQAVRPPPKKKLAAQRILEVLPKACPSKSKELTEIELSQLVEKEELTLMELRIFLRDVLNKLGSDKKFSIFAKPVNLEEATDYLDIIEQPMDLSSMMSKIDQHEYTTVAAFMRDIDLICSNALEYNPNRSTMDKIIRHRACALKDTAYAIIKTELDKEFEKTCVEIENSRKRRGHKSATVPNFYYTLPANQQSSNSRLQQAVNCEDGLKPARSIPKPEGERFSRRVRGMNIDPTPTLETVEKEYRSSRVSGGSSQDGRDNQGLDLRSSQTPQGTICHSQGRDEEERVTGQGEDSCHSRTEEAAHTSSSSTSNSGTVINKNNKVGASNITHLQSSAGKKVSSASLLSSKRKKTSKCVWCKPRRKRTRFSISRPLTLATSGDEEVDQDSTNDETEEDKMVTDHQQTDSPQLVTDVTELEAASKEDKTAGQSRRSPVRMVSISSGSSRVVTRRSSLSPNSAHSSLVNSTSHLCPHTEVADSKTRHTPHQPLTEVADSKTRHTPHQPQTEVADSKTRHTPHQPQTEVADSKTRHTPHQPQTEVADSKTRHTPHQSHTEVADSKMSHTLQLQTTNLKTCHQTSHQPHAANLKADQDQNTKKAQTHFDDIKETCPPKSGDTREIKSHSDSQVIPGETCHQQQSTHSDSGDATKAVKKLDLESLAVVTVDSGFGSSLDSNGDSRDSLDHRKEADPEVKAVSVFSGAEANCSQQKSGEELRSSASLVLSEPAQNVVVDSLRLAALLEQLVVQTQDYRLEKLEGVYNQLSQVIYRHRLEYHKGALLADLAQKIQDLTSSKAEICDSGSRGVL